MKQLLKDEVGFLHKSGVEFTSLHVRPQGAIAELEKCVKTKITFDSPEN